MCGSRASLWELPTAKEHRWTSRRRDLAAPWLSISEAGEQGSRGRADNGDSTERNGVKLG